MSIIERAADQAGITLERDVPVRGQRTCKDIAKLIGFARKVEANWQKDLERVRRDRDEMLEKYSKLLEQVHRLERENEQFRLKERMEQIEISRKDQKFLLAEPPEEEAA